MKSIFSRYKKKRPFITFPADEEYERELRKEKRKNRILNLIFFSILGGLLYGFNKNREVTLLVILTLICLIGMFNNLYRITNYHISEKSGDYQSNYHKNSKLYKGFIEIWDFVSFIVFTLLIIYYFAPYWIYKS